MRYKIDMLDKKSSHRGTPAVTTITPLRLAGLVPAAGASRRMGRDKRRLPLGESTVLEETLRALYRGGCTPIVVVLEPTSPLRERLGTTQEFGELLLAENPHPERGMLSSIRAGLAALPPDVDAVAVQPGDHAFVPPEAIKRLREVLDRERPLLLVPRYPGRRGHPLILRRELFAEAAACDDDVGLRQLLDHRRDDLRILYLDLPGADDDLDTPEDYARRRDKRA